MNLGEKISSLRKQKNMTQFDLADKLNVSNKMISKRETNRSLPDVETIKRIADEFEISINELFECIHDKDVEEKKYDFTIIYKFKKYCFISFGVLLFSLFCTILFVTRTSILLETTMLGEINAILKIFSFIGIFASLLVSVIMFITQVIYMKEVIKKNPLVSEYQVTYERYSLTYVIVLGIYILGLTIYFTLFIIDKNSPAINRGF